MWNKKELLEQVRKESNAQYEEIIKESVSYKEKAKLMNTFILNLKSKYIQKINKNNDTETLEQILLLSYVFYIVMLEFRNKIWPYDYMAFSRRIGEIWEPFCKLPFEYPITNLKIITPLNFSTVESSLEKEIYEYIAALTIDNAKKDKLLSYYAKSWNFIDSGNVNLSLDLHFKLNDMIYNVDFKSGFSSNEKGNTNRLLLVGSIYSSISTNYKNLIFVRQPEEENNHYLKTLKDSEFWTVYCADEAYEAIREFTGFNLKFWMDENMNWENDISDEFSEYLKKNDLIKYLFW